MKSFEGKLAVVTGCGTGMGRELMRQLAAAGSHVAGCDVNPETLESTVQMVRQESPGVRVSGHICDVGLERDIAAFREAVQAEHETCHVDLLFNNAGIGGGGSFVKSPREEWDRTFEICWGGVYWSTREFLPLLIASEESHIINTSSINGFWAAMDSTSPRTAYSTAKFAIKGFSEALITDLRLNAPHVKVSVVMPGYVGTSIATNTVRILQGSENWEWSDEEVDSQREQWRAAGHEVDTLDRDQIRDLMQQRINAFLENAPTTAAEAVGEILDGVHAGHWRILVGEDARRLDAFVREKPERAYDVDFLGSKGLGSNRPLL